MSGSDKEITVYLQSGPPGTGKTHELLHVDWKKFKGRCLYFTHSHATCTEKCIELGGEPYVRHIFGLASRCPCLQKNYKKRTSKEQIIADLVSLKFSNRVVCTTCKKIKAYSPQDECPYKKQFVGIKNFHIVVTVIHCAYSKNLFDKYEPDYVAMDSCSDFINDRPWLINLNYQLDHLAFLAKIKLGDLTEDPIEALSKRKDFDSVMLKFEKAFGRRIIKLAKQIEKKDESSYDKKFLISLDNIKHYIKNEKRYGFRNRFATPAFFYLFDYVYAQKVKGKDVKLKIIDEFEKNGLLELMIKRYFDEEGIIVNSKDDGFKPIFHEQKSKVFRMGRDYASFHFKSTQLKKTQEQIKKMIEWGYSRFFNNNYKIKLALVLQKPEKKRIKEFGLKRALDYRIRQFLPDKCKNFKFGTYGNLQNRNFLGDCDFLVVIGTYAIEKSDMKQKVSDWFCCDMTDDTILKEKHGVYWYFVDKFAEILRKRRENNEMNSAIHRVYPLQSTKIIFVFAYMSKKEFEKNGIAVGRIKNEKIFEENEKRIKWLEDFVKVNNGKIYRKDAEEAMAEQFDICEERAYRIILKIVRESKCLDYKKKRLYFVKKE